MYASRINSYKYIVDLTSRILLFGAPLDGLNHKNLLTIAKDKESYKLIDDLMEPSSVPDNLTQNFKVYCDRLLDRIESFYEGVATPVTEVSYNFQPLYSVYYDINFKLASPRWSETRQGHCDHGWEEICNSAQHSSVKPISDDRFRSLYYCQV